MSEPEMEDQLRRLLRSAAKQIPDEATILPKLRQRVAMQSSRKGLQNMRNLQRTGAIAVASLIVVLLVATIYIFHPGNGKGQIGSAPQATVTVAATTIPSSTPVPTATALRPAHPPVLPKPVTVNGYTVQIDDATASSSELTIKYHITWPNGLGITGLEPSIVADDGEYILDAQNQKHEMQTRDGGAAVPGTSIAYFVSHYLPLSSADSNKPQNLTLVMHTLMVIPPPNLPAIQGPWILHFQVTPVS